MQIQSWDDLRLLVLAAEHDTLLSAARALGVASTTLSRRLAQLESELGVPLLVRTPQGTRWTEAGRVLVAALRPVATQVEASLQLAQASGNALTGTVKLSAVEGLAHAVLDSVSIFQGRYPRVSVSLDWSNQPLDVSGHEVDIGLRTLKPKAQGLVVRRVVDFEFGLYAASQAPVPRGKGMHSAWLAQQASICLGQELMGLRENQWIRTRAPRVALWVPTLSAQVHAVALGLGLAVLPDPIARNDSRLKRLGPTDPALSRTLWLVMGKTAGKSEPVRALADILTQRLRESIRR